MCVAAKNCENFTKNLYFGSSRSFKVIDVDKFIKPITSACYDKRHVCAYLQPFSHYTSQWRQNNVFRGTLFDALVKGESPHPGAWNFVTISWSLYGSPQWRFRDHSLRLFDTIPQCARRTVDGRTDTSTMAKTREAFCCRA